jgi:hypothetical protein
MQDTLARADKALANLLAAMDPFTTDATDREYTNHFNTSVAPYNHRTLGPNELVEDGLEADI